VLLRELHDSCPGGLAIEDAERPPRDLGAEGNRIGDVEDGHEHEVLVDHADARGDRLGRVTERPDLLVDDDLALVGPVEAREDVHEGGLARPVLAEEGEDLAAIHLDADVIVGQDPGELLRDAAEAQAHR
jgi:hypothetical protein